MQVVAFLNKKGGAGKTTTAIGVAFGLRSFGFRVGLIDTDPNGSASRWLETMPDLDTGACGVGELAALLPELVGYYDVLIVDSPPNDADSILHIAAVADIVMVPLAPSPIEVDQLADTVDLLDAAGSPRWIVVPVRVRLSTSAGRSIRALCEEQGVPVTRAIVPLAESISRAFGDDLPRLVYSALTRELLNELGMVSA